MMALYRKATAALHGHNGPKNENESQNTKDLFAELHANSCGLKVFATSIAAQSLEISRRAYGGHGYSSFAGIGALYADCLPSQTYEGDNYVRTL
ncbi:acyl-CoA dehydrogenase/oxidase C-terminal [Trichoderma evansii]